VLSVECRVLSVECWQAKAPLQTLAGQAAAANITFAAYMREHGYGERVAGETTHAARMVPLNPNRSPKPQTPNPEPYSIHPANPEP